jgi:hypothetical protein
MANLSREFVIGASCVALTLGLFCFGLLVNLSFLQAILLAVSAGCIWTVVACLIWLFN